MFEAIPIHDWFLGTVQRAQNARFQPLLPVYSTERAVHSIDLNNFAARPHHQQNKMYSNALVVTWPNLTSKVVKSPKSCVIVFWTSFVLHRICWSKINETKLERKQEADKTSHHDRLLFIHPHRRNVQRWLWNSPQQDPTNQRWWLFFVFGV